MKTLNEFIQEKSEQLSEDPTLGLATAAVVLGAMAKKKMGEIQKNFDANHKRKVMKPLNVNKRIK